MPAKQHDCFTLVCDLCGDECESMDGYIVHFASAVEAAGEAGGRDWYATDDGSRVVCHGEDAEHLALRREICGDDEDD